MSNPTQHTANPQGDALTFVRVPTIDGAVAKFPVSSHVLRLTTRRKLDLWRPSILQQASALVLVLSLFASSYGVTYGKLQSTLAYFRDDETSRNNVLQAGALDFTVSPDGDVSAIVEAGEKLYIPVMTPEPGTFPTMYRVVVEEFDGPNTMCTLLDASATTSPFTYTGDLLPLTVTATTTSGTWPLEISLPSAAGLVEGDECVVDLVYRGWHKDVPENTGYTDEERMRITLTYTANTADFNIVLNEFLPFPNGVAYGFDFGNDGSNMPQGEWIELYNKGGAPVDVLGWYITDASAGGGNTHAVIDGTNTIPASTIVPPGGWIVVYMNKPTLNNVDEEIHLYTDNDVEVDFVSYEQPSDGCFKEPSPGETNPADLPTGTPGNGNSADCNQAQVAPNKSYARIPDGTGAWVDPIPTPGLPNIPDPEPAQDAAPEVLGAETNSEHRATTESAESSPAANSGGGSASAPPVETSQPVENSLPVGPTEETTGGEETDTSDGNNGGEVAASEEPGDTETVEDSSSDATLPEDETSDDIAQPEPPPSPEASPSAQGSGGTQSDGQGKPTPEPASESQPEQQPAIEPDAAPSTEPPPPVDAPPPPPEPEAPPPPPPVDTPSAE